MDVHDHSLLLEFYFSGYTPGIYCYSKGKGLEAKRGMGAAQKFPLWPLILEWEEKARKVGDESMPSALLLLLP